MGTGIDKLNFKIGSYANMATATGIENGDINFGLFSASDNFVIGVKKDNKLYTISPEPGNDSNKFYPLVSMGSNKKPDYSSEMNLKKLRLYGEGANDTTGTLHIFGAYSAENTPITGISLYGGNSLNPGPKESYIKIGNSNGSKKPASNASDVDNRYGALYLYSQRTGCNIVKARTHLEKDIHFWLPDEGGEDNNAYAVWADRPTAEQMQTGTENHPIYVDSNGKVTACSLYLGTSEKPFENIHLTNFTIYGTDATKNPHQKFVAGSLNGGWESSSTPDPATLLTLGNEIDIDDTQKGNEGCHGAVKLYGQNNKFTVIKTHSKPEQNTYFILPSTVDNGATTNTENTAYAVWKISTNKEGEAGQAVQVNDKGQVVPIVVSPKYGGTGLTENNIKVNLLYCYQENKQTNEIEWKETSHTVQNNRIAINGAFQRGEDDYSLVNRGSMLIDQSLVVQSELTENYKVDLQATTMNFLTSDFKIGIKSASSATGLEVTSELLTPSQYIGKSSQIIAPYGISLDYAMGATNNYFELSSSGADLGFYNQETYDSTNLLCSNTGYSIWSSSAVGDWVSFDVTSDYGLWFSYYPSVGGYSELTMDSNVAVTASNAISMSGDSFNLSVSKQAIVIANNGITLTGPLTVNSVNTFNALTTFNKNHINLVAAPNPNRSNEEYFDIRYTQHTAKPASGTETAVSWWEPISFISTRPAASTQIYGHAIRIGGGGPVVIGGGESAKNFIDTLKKAADDNGATWSFPNVDESTYITADNIINLNTQCGNSTTESTIDGRKAIFIQEGTMRSLKVAYGTFCCEESWGYGTTDPSANTNLTNLAANNKLIKGQVYFKLIS